MRAKRPYKKRKKRVGCGTGSGHGKTSCRGHKGQRARTGSSFHPGFEGGQNPLYRRLPKRGFNRTALQSTYRTVNLSILESLGVKEITPETFKKHGILKNLKDGLKVLGTGELKKALHVRAHFFSSSAKEKIEKAGGQVTIIERNSDK